MPDLKDYTPIVGQNTIDELRFFAKNLHGLLVQNINSTAHGGGVAEILTRMVPLLQQLEVDTRWDVLSGSGDFFWITKKIHNALHGADVSLTADEIALFEATNDHNARQLELCGDIMFIHDPQPIALIKERERLGKRWIWRCHIDFSRPQESTWEFLRRYIQRYDCSVFSAPSFSRPLGIPQVLIPPSIDPLSEKNRDLPNEVVQQILTRFNIDPSRPLVTQISRFDYLKDPVGVIRAYRMVKPYLDCQLVLAGGGASDDPEGEQVLAEVRAAAAGDPDIHLILLPVGSDIEINALQRASTVVLQKSLREGFGLTVTEALWKAKPVIAGAVGGICLQITHKYSGLLTHTIEGTAFALKQLLQNPEYARQLGVNGRNHVKRNFLITRHLRDYILLFLSMLQETRRDVIFL